MIPGQTKALVVKIDKVRGILCYRPIGQRKKKRTSRAHWESGTIWLTDCLQGKEGQTCSCFIVAVFMMIILKSNPLITLFNLLRRGLK